MPRRPESNGTIVQWRGRSVRRMVLGAMLSRLLAGVPLAALLVGCAGGWQSERSAHPASRAELASCRVTVTAAEPLGAELRQALAQQGFTVVLREPFLGDLRLRAEGDLATLTSDEWFVDQVRAPDAASMAAALAVSRRVAEFVRNSGTVQQRDVVQ
jgi:hypothetical protein